MYSRGDFLSFPRVRFLFFLFESKQKYFKNINKIIFFNPLSKNLISQFLFFSKSIMSSHFVINILVSCHHLIFLLPLLQQKSPPPPHHSIPSPLFTLIQLKTTHRATKQLTSPTTHLIDPSPLLIDNDNNNKIINKIINNTSILNHIEDGGVNS